MYNKSIIFRKSDGGKIKIDVYALQKIMKYLQDDQEKCEAGGVLLGRYIIDSSDIVVDDITTPMKNDTRQRCFFLKQKKYHQKVVTEKWIKSKGTCNYLGEWHTHPEPIPTPSYIDISEWKRLLKENKFDSQYLYFIIAGTEKLRIWEGNKSSLSIILLEQIVNKGEE
ncbi:Mov34/MPN/PAD-1 family protein [Clostridium thermopalmarium]|jgi:integrative and conjugative element protein (TIGR02256 family)|uniref:JAB domain-containing protein n=1 Tax=Clostridium thermopalmarium DSM 5974 TaxID=1121340 RepID=A0A2T0AN02_9CLOT|nr:Mov34/MPN/PAD-1 family protein [Clostridium thermopalmarium]PRR70132.1 hypothetical protein CPAL_23530 [Clostridium thermopalmarium DSM 5974]PVZ23147.1 integrative and conjugative element protein (TIGR02256 family) [Clostridium thermopalmarium DSM 5974]